MGIALGCIGARACFHADGVLRDLVAAVFLPEVVNRNMQSIVVPGKVEALADGWVDGIEL